jgi:exonuclease SbcD
MRIAHLADLHLTSRGDDSGETLEQQIGRLVWIGEDAIENGAEAILVAGDLFDRMHGSNPAERNAAVRVVRIWARALPVYIVYGNHDAPGDLDFLAHLDTKREVLVLDRPGCYFFGSGDLAVLPWPRKAQLVAQMGTADRGEIGNAARGAMRSILTGFRVRFEETRGPRIVLAHAELGAAYGGTGDYDDPGQPMAGRCDIELSESDLLESGADVVLLGHIHRHQVLGDGRIVYAGSPRQTRFGEDVKKGYCLVDVERGEQPVIEHRCAPGRQLVDLIVGEYPDGEIGLLDGTACPVPGDAIVRLGYDVREDSRKTMAERVARFATEHLPGRTARLDPRVVKNARVRSEDMAAATTNADRLKALWKARGQVPERADAILAKLAQLEAEVAV